MSRTHMKKLREWFREDQHPVWYHSFPEQQREQMIDDDLVAAYSIPALLTAIVCAGLASMAFSVYMAL